MSSEMLIGCRMAQGLAAAMLIPQGLGILRDVFAPGEQASAFAALGAARVVPESRAPRPPRLDVVGTILCGLGMGLLVYPLIQGPEASRSLWTYVRRPGLDSEGFITFVG